MLKLEHITKVFNPNTVNERVALDDLSLTIETGEFVTVIGGNGSGKSTLMNIISGVIEPDKGKVLINDVDITKLAEHKRAKFLGRVFQDVNQGTCSDMQIQENLALAYRRGNKRGLEWGISKKEEQLFKELLKEFNLGLDERMTTKVGLLSGGQRQAVTLLMSTIKQHSKIKNLKKDLIKFYEGDKKQGEILVNETFDKLLKEFNDIKLVIKQDKSLSSKERKVKIENAKNDYLNKIYELDNSKQILLLDEHTAALDPKTAAKVLEMTDKVVKENAFTTIMITHNMKDAITYGNRLIMLKDGKIIYDVKGEEKQKLKVTDLLELFGDY